MLIDCLISFADSKNEVVKHSSLFKCYISDKNGAEHITVLFSKEWLLALPSNIPNNAKHVSLFSLIDCCTNFATASSVD
jgi:hypothetical protein